MFYKSDRGASLIEVMIVTIIIGVSALAVAGLSSQMLQSTQYLEFQSKKEQLRRALLGQVLTNPDNCKCMFSGATEFPTAGTGQLEGYVAPTALGSYSANCVGGVTSPLVSTSGVDGMKLTGLSLENLSVAGSQYSGFLSVHVSSMKQVAGPNTLHLRIPVAVTTTLGSTGHVVMQSCSVNAASTASPTLQGTALGTAITDSFTSNNTTRANTYMLSSYPNAIALSYVCTTACRDASGSSYVKITFQIGGADIYSATACQTAEINDGNTSWDRRSGILIVPSRADRVHIEAAIQHCDNGNQSNQSSLQFFL